MCSPFESCNGGVYCDGIAAYKTALNYWFLVNWSTTLLPSSDTLRCENLSLWNRNEFKAVYSLLNQNRYELCVISILKEIGT